VTSTDLGNFRWPDSEREAGLRQQIPSAGRLAGKHQAEAIDKRGRSHELILAGLWRGLAWYNPIRQTMDKALRLLGKLKNNLVCDEELARAAWRAAVGDRIEAHARFRELVRDRIVVEVDDRVWQSQMHALERQILSKLERMLGKVVARQIEYRIAIPRLQPQSEGALDFQLRSKDPEADRIGDHGLRRMYLRSKRRASGQ
jgi:hypothetical protein